MKTSRSNARRYSTGDGQPGSVVWFISFGDLLTLLLCFFLVLTPWERLKQASNTQSLQKLNAQHDAATIPGTTFASDLPLRGSVIKLELPLFEEVVSQSAEGSPLIALEREISQAMSQQGRVEVAVCSAPAERASVVRFVGEAIDRSLGGSSAVRFVVSRTCHDLVVLAPVTKKVVGRVRIVGT